MFATAVYDHAWENCVRMNSNRSTKYAYENEKKGVGCRKKKSKVVFSLNSSPSKKKGKSSAALVFTAPQKTITNNKNLKSTVESEADESNSRHSPSILGLSYFDEKNLNKRNSDVNFDEDIIGHNDNSVNSDINSDHIQ